jgi:hypothetical protein
MIMNESNDAAKGCIVALGLLLAAPFFIMGIPVLAGIAAGFLVYLVWSLIFYTVWKMIFGK